MDILEFLSYVVNKIGIYNNFFMFILNSNGCDVLE